MSISSYWVLHRRAGSRPERAEPKEPLWSRWYVPWLAAALVLAALIVAAIAVLEIVTAPHQPPVATEAQPAQAEVGSDAGLISTER